MSVRNAQFPTTPWDGLSLVRPTRNSDREPRYEDWDQITAELIATQKRMMFGGPLSSVSLKGGNFSIAAEDDGATFILTAAAAATLPTKVAGLTFKLVQSADADMTITGNADIIHKGSATATSVVFSTVGQKIGSVALIECVNINGTLKWLVSNLGGTTATVV